MSESVTKPWVHWLIPGGYTEINALFASNLASIRMRAGLVGQNSAALSLNFSAGDLIAPQTQVIVIGKIGADCTQGRALHWLDQIKNAKSAQQKVILDYTDHHLGQATSSMRSFYAEALPFVEKAVVSSQKMQRHLKEFFKGHIEIIADPIEVQIIPPRRAAINGMPTVLWFGHSSNINYLVNYLQNQTLCDADFNLLVLTNEAGAQIFSSRPIQVSRNIQVHLAPWSLPNMITAANSCHACLIPSNIEDPAKSGASSNRLITALTLGLPTLSEKLDSYAPYSNYFCDIRLITMSAFLRQRNLETEKVARAQNDIVPQYLPQSLLQKWRAILNPTD